MSVTKLLTQIHAGDDEARRDLLQLVYDDLRRMAEARLRQERPDHSLTATSLVHELSIRLLQQSDLPVTSRGDFFRYAARAMRNLLINYARDRARGKRSGRWKRIELREPLAVCQQQPAALLELDQALTRLGEIDPRKQQVVELRYFGGLSIAEAAEVLEVSPATVKRDWEVSRSWLFWALGPQESSHVCRQ